VRKYLAVAKILFKAQIIYRFDVAMTALAAIGRVLFAWILWGTIFSGRDTVGGFTFQAMLSYYLVSSFLATLEMSDGVSGEVSGRIRNGTFSRFMVIPTNPQLTFMAQNFGAGGYYALFAVLAAVLSTALFGVQPIVNHEILSLICALMMIPLGLMFMVSYQFFIGVLTFKFQDITVFWYLQRNIIALATGTLFPLSLLPETAISTLRLLPFTYVTYMPAMLITGQLRLREGLFGFAVLAVWTTGMPCLSSITYNRLRVKYEGVGI
jgi:ABC-2 type transport system permease protein